MKTIKVWLKIINCCSKGNVVSLRNSMKFPEANKYMDTKKPRDSSSLPKNSHWFEILSCLRLKKGLFTPTLYFLELSSHQTVDFPEQGEPQKSLSLWVHAHSFFFRGTEDGPEKLSLEWVLFSLKANLVIKVRNRTISKRCCLIYFSLSLKARQATYSPYGCTESDMTEATLHARTPWKPGDPSVCCREKPGPFWHPAALSPLRLASQGLQAAKSLFFPLLSLLIGTGWRNWGPDSMPEQSLSKTRHGLELCCFKKPQKQSILPRRHRENPFISEVSTTEQLRAPDMHTETSKRSWRNLMHTEATSRSQETATTNRSQLL